MIDIAALRPPGVGGALQMPALQVFDTQSAAAEHVPPFAHFVAQLPPQSTSVSLPFFTPSVQLAVTGARHVPLVQMPLAQSAAAEHVPPLAHFVAQLPPQSTSVSLPF